MTRSEQEPDERRSMKRRRFLHLLAASGAAVAASGLQAGAAAAADAAGGKARSPRAKTHLPPAVRREIENQKKAVADMVKVVRDHRLPPGSDPAFTFRAIRARRGVR